MATILPAEIDFPENLPRDGYLSVLAWDNRVVYVDDVFDTSEEAWEATIDQLAIEVDLEYSEDTDIFKELESDLAYHSVIHTDEWRKLF